MPLEPPAFTFDFSGQYALVRVTQPVECTPQPPAPPASDDTTRYVQLPTAVAQSRINITVAQRTPHLSVVMLDAVGHPDSSRISEGTIVFVQSALAGSFSTTRPTATRTEGPRVDGRTLTVVTQAADTGLYVKTNNSNLRVPSLLGGDASVTENSSGAETYVFHDGGSNGPVVAMCTMHLTTSGNRLSP